MEKSDRHSVPHMKLYRYRQPDYDVHYRRQGQALRLEERRFLYRTVCAAII